jgi:hypothetical protein
LRTSGDWTLPQILRKLYDDAAAAGEEPKYISVVDTTPGDKMWANYEIDMVTFHKTGTLVVILAEAIVIAIVTYFLIHSLYFIATGETIPTPGYQSLVNPKTGEKEIVPVGYYYDANGNLVSTGLDLGILPWILLALGGLYFAGKFIERK